MSLRPVPAALAALAIAALAAGCAQPAPEERVSELRAGYQVTLNSMAVREEPVAAPAAAPVVEATAAAPEAPADDADSAAEPAAEAAETAAVEPDVRQDVVLDLLIRNDNDERLPGLTVDVEQAADGEVKTSYRIWVDVSGIAPGTEGAVSHILRDVDYAPGDGFAVEVRQAIPPEQLDQYRELAEAAPQP